MASQYYLPLRTESLVKKRIGQCQNLALILDKYPERIAIEDTEKKSEWLQQLAKKDAHIDKGLIEASYKRWAVMTEKLHATRFQAKLSWRMVIGLGGGNALETDLTLHHHYGIPFIPGSALKGLTRAYVAGEEEQFFIAKNERKVPSSSSDEDHEEVKRIFGTQNSAGTVTFYDAIPYDGTCAFAVDIMNPHYPDYYKTLKNDRGTPPGNDQNPIPIAFLTVDTMKFAFAVAPRDPQDSRHVEDAEKVAAWLQTALTKYGVGGKTSAGYGLFQRFETIEDSVVASPAVTHLIPTPTFLKGIVYQGVVLAPTADLKALYPDATQYLSYRDFPITQLLLVVGTDSPEALDWKVKDTRSCLCERTEERDGVTIVVCKTNLNKKNKNKKKK
ncbi:type III-B CRISPR module RAMP protein Cmr6 [Tengunoibacter tsumagoiensis]|uniref:CRISPR type III-associated protein domain-containing protein n=1 Tax=Tengunoibacter tsumagoiensis TaxID=2014871 RepID=A0A402A9M3_9CHLR|nr:type III-B CRISPR module RAMP protein Cmr6 [Tengunoibacter tsumagoiensis]GCE15840.1 hypothetical protein KTT_56990 [Tengunoibacter tsumagoiensis]